MTPDLDSRIGASLTLLEDFLARGRAQIPHDARLLAMAYDGVAEFSLGGKHLRSRLVHISAGDVVGEGGHDRRDSGLYGEKTGSER